MSFVVNDFVQEELLRKEIQECQKENHVQQVAFSTFHNCLTQICFTCGCVRTSLCVSDAVKAGEIK